MDLFVGKKLRAKFLNSLDYGRIADVVIKEIEVNEPKPVYIGGRRIGTPIHPKGKLFFLAEINADGTEKVTACFHERHLRFAELGSDDWWCV